jgi:hypothetical protein
MDEDGEIEDGDNIKLTPEQVEYLKKLTEKTEEKMGRYVG